MGSQKTFHCVIHARLCYYQLKSQFAQKLKYLKDNSVRIFLGVARNAVRIIFKDAIFKQCFTECDAFH